MGLTNDERGWIMTCISGVACVLGASIICADVIIRQFPGKKNFRIQDSDAFLSSSLSLSFGVMLFSSLYSMLPSAKKSLQDGGFSPKVSAWILISCFLGGAVVIQLVSRILHAYMPTHIVDCEHSHDENGDEDAKEVPEAPHHHGHEHHGHDHGRSLGHDHDLHNEHLHDRPVVDKHRPSTAQKTHRPLLGSGSSNSIPSSYLSAGQQTTSAATSESEQDLLAVPTANRRPSLQARLSQKLSSITNKKGPCDCDAPCYGFSEPCGTDCFKNVRSRGSFRMPSSRSLRRGNSRSIPALHEHAVESTPLLQETRTTIAAQARAASVNEGDTTNPTPELILEEDEGDFSNSPTLAENAGSGSPLDRTKTAVSEASHEHHQPDHHHHVPTNAFLSIGLQTSIAIALHKLPEGFITYATNHANPKLGFSVFLALFIHNITEGFALALPLYLAINSRWKAMFWSFILGGCSQPLGAGVAALWFKIAGKGDYAPGEGIYGGMFAVTAGIMASVALQLFSESLDLTHNRGLCMIFAFIGMGVLGVSSALTA